MVSVAINTCVAIWFKGYFGQSHEAHDWHHWLPFINIWTWWMEESLVCQNRFPLELILHHNTKKLNLIFIHVCNFCDQICYKPWSPWNRWKLFFSNENIYKWSHFVPYLKNLIDFVISIKTSTCPMEEIECYIPVTQNEKYKITSNFRSLLKIVK